MPSSDPGAELLCGPLGAPHPGSAAPQCGEASRKTAALPAADRLRRPLVTPLQRLGKYSL